MDFKSEFKPIIVFASHGGYDDHKVECSICGDAPAPKVIYAFYHFLMGCGYSTDVIEKYFNMDKVNDDY